MKITRVEVFQIETPRRCFNAEPQPPLRPDGTRPLYSITSEGAHPSKSQSPLSTGRTGTRC